MDLRNWTSQEHQNFNTQQLFWAQSKPGEPFKTPTLIIIPANIQNVSAQHGRLLLNRLPPLDITTYFSGVET